MKKAIVITFLIALIMSCFNVAYATEINVLNTEAAGELIQMKENAKSSLAEYQEKYGSNTYGLAAYILNGVRIYSIPLCFLGIALGAIYQYVLGIRKLDVRDRGFNLVITFVTILVICQVLPLIFTIVVQGWRG